MAVEQLAGLRWELRGYLAKMRVAVKKVGWTDFDVLAYSPKKRHLVVIESKLNGPPDRVWACRQASYILNTPRWVGFIANIPLLWSPANRPAFAEWLPEKAKLKRLTVELVGNFYLMREYRKQVLEGFRRYTQKILRRRFSPATSIEANVLSSVELFEDAFRLVKEKVTEQGQGRRFGSSIADVLRELHRYTRPSASGAGHGASREVREDTLKRLGTLFAGRMVSGNG